MSDQTIPNEITSKDTTINDLYVTGNVGIGIGATGPATARLEVKSQDSAIGTIKLFPNSGAGRDFSYDGGTDNVFVFSHYGQQAGITQFIWDNGGSPIPLLTIKNTGNIGIGTSEPQAPLHVKNYMAVGPFAATNGEGGIEVAGALAEFSFVRRNLTSWPATPVAGDRFVWYNPEGTARLWTEVKGDLVTVTANGNFGIATPTPEAKLHLVDSFRGSIKLLATSGVGHDFGYDGGGDSLFWFTHYGKESGETKFRWDTGTSNRDLLTIKNTGNIGIGTTNPSEKLEVVGNIKVTGTLIQASSREMKENVAELSGSEAVKALENLNPVKFNYKADSEKNLHIGFIAEDVSELVATSDRKGVSSMDIIAVLTQVVKEQQKTMAALAEKVKRLEAQTA